MEHKAKVAIKKADDGTLGGRALVCPAKEFADLFEWWSEEKPDEHHNVPIHDKGRFRSIESYIGTYCTLRNFDRHSIYVKARPNVIAAVEANSIGVDYDVMHWEIVKRTDGTALVVCRNGQIIGGPWVALIDPKSVPS